MQTLPASSERDRDRFQPGFVRLFVNPAGLERWQSTHHPKSNLLSTVLRRPPLVVLAGDVGSGKTELAETIGDAVARTEKIDLTLLPLSLSTRGQGRVGEMTQLLSAAFDHAFAEGTPPEDRLELGCVAAHGQFSLNEVTADYTIQHGGKPATAFLFNLISRLQFSGTVPMIDVQAYGRWLSAWSIVTSVQAVFVAGISRH